MEKRVDYYQSKPLLYDSLTDEQKTELVIKPGELYQITDNQQKLIDKSNRFVNPGEILVSNIVIQNREIQLTDSKKYRQALPIRL